jgi:hypothetical protein
MTELPARTAAFAVTPFIGDQAQLSLALTQSVPVS